MIQPDRPQPEAALPDPAAPPPTDEAEAAGAAASMPPQRLSEILDDIAAQDGRDRISLGDILGVMHGRAFGALLLIFAFPNILPTPPGTAGVLGLPLLFLSTQMMLGQMPWLPRFIARRSLSREAFVTLVGHARPWLMRAERLLRARLVWLAHPRAQRFIGGICLIVSAVLVLPVPFGNMAPSVAICIIALGVLERDGLWILAGLAAAAGAVVFVAGLAYALVKSAIFVILNAF